MNKLMVWTLVFTFFTGFAQSVRADEISELKQQLAQLQKRLEKLEARQAAQQAQQQKQQIDQQKQLDEKISKAVDQKVEEKHANFELPSNIKWVENIKLSGDFRYRHETIHNDAGFTNDDGKVSEHRDRNRIRARLGIKARLNSEWDVIFRLASGSSDAPTSTNQTLGDSFSKNQFWLDRAYVDWHPENIQGLNVYLGKMKNPFYTVGKNQMIWDSDVNPEGGAASYVMELNSCTSAQITGGAFWLNEDEADADAGYFGLQGLLKHDFHDTNKSYALAGISVYNLGNIENNSLDDVDFLGNSVVNIAGNDRYRYDYNIFEGFAEYGFEFNDTPLAFFGDYANNLDAPENKNTAWLIGTSINKTKAPGSWQFTYDYRDVESDAVFAGLSDSDFIGGGTNGKGHKFSLAYQLTKNIKTQLTYFMTKRYQTDSTPTQDSNFNLLQADLIFKF